MRPSDLNVGLLNGTLFIVICDVTNGALWARKLFKAGF